MKKLFTLFLALVASVSAIYAQSGTCGDNLTWEFDAETGVLTVSGTGVMYDFKTTFIPPMTLITTENPWKDFKNAIKSVIVNDGVTSIGEYAFSDCSSLTSVTIPNSVTRIGSDAFRDCIFLTSVAINSNAIVNKAYDPSNNLSNIFGSQVTEYIIGNKVNGIGKWAFENCISLASITIPNSVTSIGERAFQSCKSLTSITIPNSVTNIGTGAFYNCSGLISVTVGDGVTSIGNGGTFQECTALKSVHWNATNCIVDALDTTFHIPFYELSNITEFVFGETVEHIPAYLCYGLSGLTSVTIPNSVKSIGGWAFYNCSGLSSVTIGDSVTSIRERAFDSCTSLTSIIIPNSVTNIGTGAFYNCSGLISVTVGNGVTNIGNGGTFQECTALRFVRWNATNCIVDKASDGIYYPLFTNTNNTSNIIEFVFGETVEHIPAYLCYQMNKLTSIALPNNLKTIGVSAFEGCVRLGGRLTFGTKVESIDANAFAGCARFNDIYCFATYPPYAEESSFANYNANLYIPCESKRYYTSDPVWNKFINMQCIESDNVTTDEIVVTPSDNEANVIWPSVNGAATYELVIRDKNGNIVCTLIFNANGQLISIAFNAPSRNGVPAQTQSAGFSFTITGLDSGTGYDLTITAKDNSGNTIEETTIPFQTNKPEGIEDVQGDEVQSTKVVKDGQVLILRNGKTYTMQGQEVK